MSVAVTSANPECPSCRHDCLLRPTRKKQQAVELKMALMDVCIDVSGACSQAGLRMSGLLLNLMT